MIEFIEKIKNKYNLFFTYLNTCIINMELLNKIIIYSFSKLNIFENQYSTSNNETIKNNNRIAQNINYSNNEEMYGQFIYFD